MRYCRIQRPPGLPWDRKTGGVIRVKVESVFIADIKMSRDLEDGDDLTELAASIAHLDIKIPVLLDRDNRLIDGLRRIRVFQNMSRQTVACVRSRTFEQSIEHLTKAREHGVEQRPMTPRHIFLLYEDLHDQIMDRVKRNRKARKGLSRYDSNPVGSSRPLLADALGVAPALINHTHTLYKRALLDTDEGRWAAGLVALVDSGELSVHAATGRLKSYNLLNRHPISMQEQRQLMEGILIQTAGVVRAFERVGRIQSGITTAELDALIAGLSTIRGKVMTLGNRLRKEREGRTDG